MATITITIIESPLQYLAGIPSNVTLETDIPATIFYTLDNSDPTIQSDVAIGPIELPKNLSYVVLKIFATNGIDFSPIITEEYKTNIVPGRQPHDKVIINDDIHCKATYPFGSPSSVLTQPMIFENTGGIITDDQTLPREPDGYDGTGTGTGVGFFNIPKSQYDILFSETDEIGKRGVGIGTLPARVLYSTPRNNNVKDTSTNTASPLFNPKALVIFQDSRDEPYDAEVPKINRPFFDLEDQAKVRDGSLLSNTDPITPQGGFLKAHYNPTDNSLTYYYYDNRVARWIISKEPYYTSQNPTMNLSGIVSRSRNSTGAGLVFKWIPFKYRRLI